MHSTGRGIFPKVSLTSLIPRRACAYSVVASRSLLALTCIFTALGIGPSLSSDIVKHLEKYSGTTLKTLRLDPGPDIYADIKYEPVPSLKGFPTLRDLFLNSLLLYRLEEEMPENLLVRLLPPSLVSLHIRVAKGTPEKRLDEIAACLTNLAKVASQNQFPCLEQISRSDVACLGSPPRWRGLFTRRSRL